MAYTGRLRLKGVGISLVEVHERGGKSVIAVDERLKGLTDDFAFFYNRKFTVSSEVMVMMMPGGRGVIELIFADLGHWPPRTDTPL